MNFEFGFLIVRTPDVLRVPHSSDFGVIGEEQDDDPPTSDFGAASEAEKEEDEEAERARMQKRRGTLSRPTP